MVLVFRSSVPEKFELVGQDSDGSRRVATATREAGNQRWDMRLTHPSGRTWSGSYSGSAGILDALSELLNSKEDEFKLAKGRGHRAQAPLYDDHRPVGTVAPIVPYRRG